MKKSNPSPSDRISSLQITTMSGRDDRGYSDSRRHQSSPKRTRRDVKVLTENSDRDQKHHRRLQDVFPLDDPKYPDSKLESGSGDKKSNKKNDRQHEEGTTKHSSDRSDLLHSKSYSQHDDQRRNSSQAHKSAGDRAAKDDGGWKDSKRGKVDDRKPNNRVSTYDSKLENDDRPRHRNEKNEQPPSKKRTFTERKISPTANGNGDKEVVVGQGVRNNERERRNFHYSDRRENRREVTGHEDENENKKRNGGYQSRGSGWFGGGENSYYNRGRDNNRSGYRTSGVRPVEKWKHDLFDQANRSPSPKKDEDLTAKIESLLAS